MNRQQKRDATHKRKPSNRNAGQPSIVGLATLRASIQRDVQHLRMEAGLHAWCGNNATKALNNAGRLMWIVMHAAIAGGMPTDAPDLRILQGMGNALGDMCERGDPLDQHRTAIQSGLLAADRLLPHCTELRLVIAAAELNVMLRSERGLGTADVERLMEVAA